MSGDDGAVTLEVRGAEKRDAGRGIARLPESARRQIGVISGDTVIIQGEKTTVAKYWPGGVDMPEGIVRIDADTRANAGISIGDEVQVSQRAIEDADTITLAYPPSLEDVDIGLIRRSVKSDLRDRPVKSGEQVHLERITDAAFQVTKTNPAGPVLITESTTVLTDPSSYGTSTETGSGETTAGDDAGEDVETDDTGSVTYEDIGGLDEELEQVREMIEVPLNEPEVFQRLGIEPPKGVLLYGPPGTGKTLIAKAVANEVDAEFISVPGPEIMSKYKGESEKRIRETFEQAQENSPAIIFFDEIDAIAGKRDDESDVENRVVAQLLSLMDGLDPRGEVIIIGATNRVDTLDPALRRGGRFDREIEIGVPSEDGRQEILEVQTRNMTLGDDVSIDGLAERTHGFVGADLHAMVTEAAMEALPRFREAVDAESEAGDATADGGTETADTPATEDGETPPEEAVTGPAVMRSDFNAAMAAVEPSAMREFVAEAPDTTYDDVGGLEDAKQTLTEAVEWPITYETLFDSTNTRPPSGVLLYGPPGTGKTTMGRALAGESKVNFIHVNGPELIDKYVGESEKAVREVFDRARQAAPAVVFFDEIDSIAGTRGADTHEVTERVVSQLLTELDNIADNPNMMVLAATNRRDEIDPALLRPGRLDTHIEVPAPDAEARRKIFEVHCEGKPLADDVDLGAMAEDLENYTGADIEAIVREASMRAIRETATEYGPETANDRASEVLVTKAHFDAAIAQVDPTLADRDPIADAASR
jgi:transitional endoplasmic reticulum ATPase